MNNSMEAIIKKAEILIEALPYIQKLFGKTVVIKYGGNAMINEELKNSVMEDITLLKYIGMNPVVVHGGGPEINKALDAYNIKSQFINGLRVTDADTMGIAQMVLVGKTNKEIAYELGIAEQTVKNYVSTLYDKLGVHDRVSAVLRYRGGA